MTTTTPVDPNNPPRYMAHLVVSQADIDLGDEALLAMGWAALNEITGQAGLMISGDVVEVERAAAIREVAPGTDGVVTTGYRYVEEGETPNAWGLRWECDTVPRREALPEVVASVQPDGRIMATIPEEVVQANGGEVNIRHDLGIGVSVTYLDYSGDVLDDFGMAVEIDDNIVEVSVPYGARQAVVTPDAATDD